MPTVQSTREERIATRLIASLRDSGATIHLYPRELVITIPQLDGRLEQEYILPLVRH